jgi:hypothetical protein
MSEYTIRHKGNGEFEAIMDDGEVKDTSYSLEGKWFDIDTKLCYCGNPVDTSDPDCVTYDLCKEHAMDV